jgi:hypothetical protein
MTLENIPIITLLILNNGWFSPDFVLRASLIVSIEILQNFLLALISIQQSISRMLEHFLKMNGG